MIFVAKPPSSPTPNHTSVLAFSLLLCALSPRAQEQRPLQLPASTIHTISRSAGVHMLDGALVGAGDRYKVKFGDNHVELTPALGRAAPRDYSLVLRLVSVHRSGGGETQIPLTTPTPTFHELCVEYDRGIAVERYDVGVDSMEQSFVFAERPAGRGDLIVRVRLDTDMEVSRDGDGLCFLVPGIGGMRMGGVVGVDGNGARVKGRADYRDGLLELSLPAAFVDGAALPLTLDPPFGNPFVISGAAGSDDETPASAYDASNDVFLVVWRRVFSATNIDIRAHRVSRAAQPVGGLINVVASSGLELEPDVANCPSRNAFVVVYNLNGDIIGRTVAAADGAVSGPTVIAGGPGSNQHFPSLATDFQNPGVLCVWMSDGDVALQSRRVNLSASLAMTLGPLNTFAVALSPRAVVPRLSKSDRGSGRHALVFQRELNNGTNSDIAMMLLDANGVPIGNELQVATTSLDEQLPTVDGDGATWVIAWQRPFGVNDHDVVVRSATFDPIRGTVQFGPALFRAATPADEGSPTVSFIGESCLVGWMQQVVPNTARWSARVSSIEPFTCLTCEGTFSVGIDTMLEQPPVGCAVQTGGPQTGEAVLLAWARSELTAFNGDIIVRAWNTVDGAAVDFGGGCADGGRNHADCARSPNSNFSFRLRSSLPTTASLLVVSGSQSSFACGGCTLVPNLVGGVILGATTDAAGNASYALPIGTNSPMIGVPLFTQWATIDLSTPSCTLFGLEMSNALRVTVE